MSEFNTTPCLNPKVAFDALRLLGRDHHTLVAINMRQKSPTAGLDVTLSDPASWQQAVDWMNQYQQAGWNIYFHVNATRPGLNKKAKKEDIVSCEWAQSDVDPTDGLPYEAGRAGAWQTVQGLLNGQTPPTLIFDSGNGFYPLWRLSEPMDVATYDDASKGFNRSHGVKGTFNADRVLKLPGTIAWSNAKKLEKGFPDATQSGVIYANGAILDRDVFAGFAGSVDGHTDKPKRKADETPGAAFDPVPCDPPFIAKVEALRQQDPLFDKHMGRGGPDRSNALQGIAHCLVRAGWTTQEYAAAVLELSGDAGDHVDDQERPLRTLRRAWDNAKAEHDRMMSKFPAVVTLPPGAKPYEPKTVEVDPVVDKVADLIGGGQMEMAYRTVVDTNDPEFVARFFAAGYFTEGDRRTLTHWRGDFYRWIGTHWEVMADSDVKDVLFHFFTKIVCVEKEKKVDGEPIIVRQKINPTQPFISNYLAALRAVTKRSSAVEPGWNKAEPGTWRSVQNGILDLDTGKLVAHTPDFFNHTWIDAEWHADAEWTGTRAEAFFNEALDTPEQVRSMQEVYGYILSGVTWLQKGFMFIGEKRTGKGTNIKLLKALEGNLVYSIRSSLLSNQFVMEGAVGKSLMVVPDVRLSKDSDFNAIGELILTVTGEDDVDVQRKNKPVWSGKTTVRLIMMSNSIPLLRDPDGVLATRFIYLEFPNSFYGREDPGLFDALLVERSAILRWAVEGWQRVRKQKKFTVTSINAQMQADAEFRMDPVGQFFKQCLEITGDAKDYVTVDLTFSMFQLFIQDKDVGVWSKDGFTKKVKTKPLKISEGKINDGFTRVYRGVRIPKPPLTQ